MSLDEPEDDDDDRDLDVESTLDPGDALRADFEALLPHAARYYLVAVDLSVVYAFDPDCRVDTLDCDEYAVEAIGPFSRDEDPDSVDHWSQFLEDWDAKEALHAFLERLMLDLRCELILDDPRVDSAEWYQSLDPSIGVELDLAERTIAVRYTVKTVSTGHGSVGLCFGGGEDGAE